MVLSFFIVNEANSQTTSYGNPSAGTSGTNNVFLGTSAGASATGNYNTFTGYQAGFNTAGTGNVINGYQAGYYNLTGNYNVINGYGAGINSRITHIIPDHINWLRSGYKSLLYESKEVFPTRV